MDFKQINVYEVLKIQDVELFETFKENGVLITRGDLLLLYSPEYNWFILKINDFNYGLNKKIPLLASSREPEAARAYVLPTVESYFVIKIASAYDVLLNQLEDVLRNNSDFAYKEGAKGEGLPIELEHSTVKIKKVEPDEGDKAGWNVAQIIYSGGKNIHKLMISSAEAIAGGMSKVGGSIESTYMPVKKEEMDIEPKTVSRMTVVNSAAGMSSSMSTSYIKGLMSFSKSIGQKIAKVFEKQDYDKEVEEIRQKEEDRQKQVDHDKFEGSAIKASVQSVFMIWHGLAEALDILRCGFSDTTSHMVAQKFGPMAGQVVKASIGVAGAGVRIPTLPGQKYLRYMNKF